LKGRLFSTHQVGQLLRVDPSTVAKWMAKGYLVGFSTPGGHRRIQETDLVTFLRERRMPVPKQLEGTGEVPKGCQHVHLTSSMHLRLATCKECGVRFRLEPLKPAPEAKH
jgi:excisionase family DNA binding protein